MRFGNRLFWLKATICLGLLLGLLLSYHLWAGPRLYPVTPVAPFLGPLPGPVEYLLLGLMIVLLGRIVVLPLPAILIFCLLGIALTLALFDQSRWQPWFYQYLVMLLAVGLGLARTDDSALDICRLIIACVYFWSGIQKLNPGFVDDTFAWMLGPLIRYVPAPHAMAFAAPVMESLIGVGLLLPRSRNVAVCLAIAMHGFILASIGPLGHNSNKVVWPWNLAMCVLLILLFWRTPDVRMRDVLWGRKLLFHKLVLVLFGIMPALSLVDLWDSYLSFALYCGNQKQATIYMADSVSGRLPDALQEVIDEHDSKVDTLDVEEWSYTELNVPPYAEMRIYRNVGKRVCGLAGNSPRMLLVVQGRRSWFRRRPMSVYTCASLAAW